MSEIPGWEEFGLPHPRYIADQYASVTGEAVARTVDYDVSELIGVGYGLYGGKADLGCVLLHVEREGEPAAHHMLPVSQFDPATQQWRTAPNMVDPRDHAALGQFFDRHVPQARRMLGGIARGGDLAVDVFAAQTAEMRQALAGQLGPIAMEDLLQRDRAQELLAAQNLELRGTDSASFCFPVLEPFVPASGVETVGGRPVLIRSDAIKPAQLLAVCYNGVRIAHPRNEGYTARATFDLPLAQRRADDPAEWEPDLTLISKDEWDVLRPAPAMLETVARRDPRFSPFYCATAYNNRY
jgi:hypothetical protein